MSDGLADHPPGQLVIATAGHIDHGKTALLRAMTAFDAAAPEERGGASRSSRLAHLALADGS